MGVVEGEGRDGWRGWWECTWLTLTVEFVDRLCRYIVIFMSYGFFCQNAFCD